MRMVKSNVVDNDEFSWNRWKKTWKKGKNDDEMCRYRQREYNGCDICRNKHPEVVVVCQPTVNMIESWERYGISRHLFLRSCISIAWTSYLRLKAAREAKREERETANMMMMQGLDEWSCKRSVANTTPTNFRVLFLLPPITLHLHMTRA